MTLNKLAKAIIEGRIELELEEVDEEYTRYYLEFNRNNSCSATYTTCDDEPFLVQFNLPLNTDKAQAIKKRMHKQNKLQFANVTVENMFNEYILVTFEY